MSKLTFAAVISFTFLGLAAVNFSRTSAPAAPAPTLPTEPSLQEPTPAFTVQVEPPAFNPNVLSHMVSEADLAPELPPVRHVRATAIAPVKVFRTLEAAGNLEAKGVYYVYSKTAGPVGEVLFEEGDRVSTGQLLCRVVNPDLTLQEQRERAIQQQVLNELDKTRHRANVAQERAAMSLAEASATLERLRAVHEKGGVPTDVLEKAEQREKLARLEVNDINETYASDLKARLAAVTAQDTQLSLLTQQVCNSKIVSPFCGVVEKRHVNSGMYVNVGSPLATIIDARALKLKFRVAEKDLPHVAFGDRVSFTVPAYGARAFKAEITRISDVCDPGTRQVTCWARVMDEQEHLKPGFTATVRLQSKTDEFVLLAPLALLNKEADGSLSGLVYNQGKAEKRRLTTARYNATTVEILAGLCSGEKLITDTAGLQDGALVELQDELN